MATTNIRLDQELVDKAIIMAKALERKNTGGRLLINYYFIKVNTQALDFVVPAIQ